MTTSSATPTLLELLHENHVLAALDRRLTAIAAVLVPELKAPLARAGVGVAASTLLPIMVERCALNRSTPETWLLMCGVTARWPERDEVLAVRRLLEVGRTEDVVRELLDLVVRRPGHGAPELELDLVVDGVLVCVDFCARYDYNSGIQRTVRRTLPRWLRDGHDVVACAWTRTADAARTLRPREHERVFDYSDERAGVDGADASPVRLVVPWDSTVVLPEVAVGRPCAPLAALAELSGNAVSAIGYDAIPLVYADLRRATDSERFAQYLSVVKHVHRIAGISASATLEFEGFSRMLGAQGLPGPRVSEVLLPAEPPDAANEPLTEPVLPHTSGRVQVLCVGAKETHKNHRTVLHAAERLWREGLAFDLTFIGGRGWTPEQFEAAFDRMAAAGRPVRHLGRLPDPMLDAAYREADVMVFLSLQEGFGLPAAEALSCGTPVLTSDYGSLAEIAADGGALLADPRDDDQVTDQLRRLVTDPELRGRLADEARARPVRTWDEYAVELWTALVEQP